MCQLFCRVGDEISSKAVRVMEKNHYAHFIIFAFIDLNFPLLQILDGLGKVHFLELSRLPPAAQFSLRRQITSVVFRSTSSWFVSSLL